MNFQHFWKSSLPFPSFLAQLDALPVADPAPIIEFSHLIIEFSSVRASS